MQDQVEHERERILKEETSNHRRRTLQKSPRKQSTNQVGAHIDDDELPP